MANYTQQFRTKSINLPRQNPKVSKFWGMAIDAGYSSMKIMSPNKICSFPSYAKRIDGENQLIGKADKNSILYKDGATGDVWVVGAIAQNMISLSETEDSVVSLYGRNRYFSPMFKVITETAIAFGLKENSYGKKPDYAPIMVQTGLPSAYKSDAEDLTESLAGHHDFYLKFADEPWEHYVYDLDYNNIFVMPQPMGTLQSICTDKDGRKIFEANKYMKSSMLIFDPGFGTLDTFDLQNRLIKGGETYPELSMKRVLSLLSDRLSNEQHTKIPVPAIQKYLESGEVTVRNRKEMTSKKFDFSTMLEECNRQVCLEAIEKIKTVYDNLFEHEYLVITGGTGEAWSKIIREHFAGLETLTIIDGNQNDVSLPFIFSNVRGYYMFLLDRMKLLARNQ